MSLGLGFSSFILSDVFPEPLGFPAQYCTAPELESATGPECLQVTGGQKSSESRDSRVDLSTSCEMFACLLPDLVSMLSDTIPCNPLISATLLITPPTPCTTPLSVIELSLLLFPVYQVGNCTCGESA